MDSNLLMGVTGVLADRTMFSDYIKANLELYKYRNGNKLTPTEAAEFSRYSLHLLGINTVQMTGSRSTLAKAIRKGPYQASVLIGGYHEEEGATLHWLDYLGTCQKVRFGSHGYFLSWFGFNLGTDTLPCSFRASSMRPTEKA